MQLQDKKNRAADYLVGRSVSAERGVMKFKSGDAKPIL
nr:Hypothetical protein [Pseudomonas aeruginosa]